MTIERAVMSVKKTSGYWAAQLDATPQLGSFGIAVDTSKNVYVVGKTVNTYDDCMITKYNSAGVLQWQKYINISGSNDQFYDVDIDSNGDIIAAGYSANKGYIIKFDSSGTIKWQSLLSGTSIFNGIKVDSSGNSYCTGAYNPSNPIASSNAIGLFKFDSSGTLSWQKSLDDGSGGSIESGLGVNVDSSGNVYIVGNMKNGSYNDAFLAKYNSSGTLQWQRQFGGSYDDFFYDIAIDSSSNIYTIGYTTSVSYPKNMTLICKYNSSGTLQWQKYISDTFGNLAYSLCIDSSDNIFIAIRGYSGNYIMKIDTSANIQWQRKISLSPSGFTDVPKITTDNLGSIYLTSSSSSNNAIVTMKLSSAGPTTGTFDSYTIESDSLSLSTGSLTSSTSTMSEISSSYTKSDPGYSTVSTSYTTSTTEIG